MKNAGKRLEEVVELIENALKDSTNTIVHGNYRIKNSGGRYREFDVFIQSKVSGHIINIAIECKDYKKAVPAEKIEAFETKCKRIPSINKKVFVSSKGFQAEAINVARDCGIELRVASRLRIEHILSWFPITKLELQLLGGGSARIFLDTETINEDGPDIIPTGTFYRNNKATLLNDYVISYYKEQRLQINNFATLQWLRLNSEMQKMPFLINIKFETPELRCRNGDDLYVNVTGIVATLNMQMVQTIVQPIESFSFTDLEGNTHADTLTVPLDDGGSANLVRTADNKTSIQISDPEGKLKHLKVIASYDAKTDIFKIVNGND